MNLWRSQTRKLLYHPQHLVWLCFNHGSWLIYTHFSLHFIIQCQGGVTCRSNQTCFMYFQVCMFFAISIYWRNVKVVHSFRSKTISYFSWASINKCHKFLFTFKSYSIWNIKLKMLHVFYHVASIHQGMPKLLILSEDAHSPLFPNM